MKVVERWQNSKEEEIIVVLDLDPPRGTDISGLMRQVQHLPVDFISVTDNSGSNVRMDSVTASYLIRKTLGIETLFHLTCRDRNLIGAESYLLGASALGLENVLTMTGDGIREEDKASGVKGVYHYNSIRLIELANTLNRGIAHHGRRLRGKTDLCVGTTANPNVYDQERPANLSAQDAEVRELRRKLEAGAEYVLTQPIFTFEHAQFFLERYEAHNGSVIPNKVPIFWGVIIPKGYEWARRVREGEINIPGITVPERVVREMKRGRTGTEIAIETMQRLIQGGVRLIYLIPPMGISGRDYEAAQEVLEAFYSHQLRQSMGPDGASGDVQLKPSRELALE